MKVVVAYSGGLDTSVILKWLQDTYQCEVVTFTADIGQGEELARTLSERVEGLLQRCTQLVELAEVRAHHVERDRDRLRRVYATDVDRQHAVDEHPHVVVTGEGESLASNQSNVITAFQFDSTDFWAFGIQQDSCFLTSFAHHVTQVFDALTVFSIVTVREVQTHNVHASIKHFA